MTFCAGALLFAVNSKSTMYEMVQNAYNVTLVGAFVPLLAGAYWKRATSQGALAAIVFGIGTWLGASALAPSAMVPPNLIGLFAAAIFMVLGSIAPQVLRHRGQSIERRLGDAAAHLKHGGAQHKPR